MGILRYISGRARRRLADTPGADALIGQYTIHSMEATPKTNEIVEFGWPNFGPSLGAGRNIKVMCSGAVIPYQLDNTRSNSSDGLERFRKITAIVTALPSVGDGSPIKVFDIYASDDAPPTGTPIGIADMQALSALASGLVAVEITDEADTLFTADLKTIFVSGTTTWSKTGKWICPDLIRSGPFCTEWRVRMAPQTSAGVLHGATGAGAGDGVHIEMHVAAFKSGAGAVSTTNPITAVKAIVCPQNEDAVRSWLNAYPTSNTARNHFYGLNIYRSESLSGTSLTNSDQTAYPYGLQRMSYPIKYPVGNLSITFGSYIGGSQPNANIAYVSARLSGGTFDTDIRGAHIHTSGYRFYVDSVVSTTEVMGVLYTTVSGSAYPSGSWKQYGIGHEYNTRYFVPVWVGARPTHVGAWGNHPSLLNPTTNAAMQYLGDSEMCLESLLSIGNIDHAGAITQISILNAPDGTMRPLTFKNAGYMAEMQTGIAGGGGRIEISWVPGFDQAGLIKPNNDGRSRIVRNAQAWTWQHVMPLRIGTASVSGGGNPTLPLRNDCGWKSGGVDTISGSYNFLRDQGGQNWVAYDSDTAHHTQAHYIPYLMTGDYHWWLWMQQQEAWTCWLARQPNVGTQYGDGTSASRNWLSADAVTPFGTAQTRGRAWPGRDQQVLTAIEPDNERTWLSNGKTYYEARLSAAAAGHAYWINTSILYSPLTGPVYDIRESSSPVPVGLAVNTQFALNFSTPWTMGFWGMTIGAMPYLGHGNSNWDATGAWISRFWTEPVSNADIVWDLWTQTFQHVWGVRGSIGAIDWTNYPTDIVDMYRRTCMVGPTNSKGWGERRVVSGTVSIDDFTTGTNRTFSFPTSVFKGGGTGVSAFYVGGWLRDLTGGILGYTSRTGGTFTAGSRVNINLEDGFTSATILSILSDDGSTGEFLFTELSTISGYNMSELRQSATVSQGAVNAVHNFGVASYARRSYARITDVVDARTVKAQIYYRFTGTSIHTEYFAIPGPHPDDYSGANSAVVATEIPYQNRAGLVALARHIGATATDPYTSALASRSGYDPVTNGPWHYWRARP